MLGREGKCRQRHQLRPVRVAENRLSKSVRQTPDGRYIIVRGRLWRAANPHLPESRRSALVEQLMQARRDVGAALRSGDVTAEKAARARIHATKVELGERGPVWWDEGTPDYNRRLLANTPYARG